MPGRGPQTFKKRQKEQQRKERQEEKMAKRLAKKSEAPRAESDGEHFEEADSDSPSGPDSEHSETGAVAARI